MLRQHAFPWWELGTCQNVDRTSCSQPHAVRTNIHTTCQKHQFRAARQSSHRLVFSCRGIVRGQSVIRSKRGWLPQATGRRAGGPAGTKNKSWNLNIERRGLVEAPVYPTILCKLHPHVYMLMKNSYDSLCPSRLVKHPRRNGRSRSWLRGHT